MPEPGRRPSTGVTRLPQYRAPLRLPRRPKAGHFRPPGWWPRPTTAVDLSRCLEDLVHMRPPLPRLERTGSPIGCSPAPNGLPLLAGGSAPARNYRGLLRVHFRYRLHTCTLVAPRSPPEASAGRSLDSAAPVATEAYRQLLGRDFHPLVFETQKVLVSVPAQLTSNLLSCRTARHTLELKTGRFGSGSEYIHFDRPGLIQPRVRSGGLPNHGSSNFQL